MVHYLIGYIRLLYSHNEGYLFLRHRMQVGIVTSGHEMLPLIRLLAQYDHAYHLYRDHPYWPYGNRNPIVVRNAIDQAINYCRSIGCDTIILPPIWEIMYTTHTGNNPTVPILPIWHAYCSYCLRYSLVGNIAFIGDVADQSIIDLCDTLLTTYEYTQRQRATKKFCIPWRTQFLPVPMRQHFIPQWSARDMLVRKTMKKDLRPLRDAGVDTIIPLNRGYLHFTAAIGHYLNHKRCRWHGIDVLNTRAVTHLGGHTITPGGYSMTIHSHEDPHCILQHKKWIALLSRGNTAPLVHTQLAYKG